MLCAEQTTLEWIDLKEFKERKCQKPLRKLRQPTEDMSIKAGNDIVFALKSIQFSIYSSQVIFSQINH